jgi:hypothetical protein
MQISQPKPPVAEGVISGVHPVGKSLLLYPSDDVYQTMVDLAAELGITPEAYALSLIGGGYG